ncbi:hypothetical protein [Nonomuraea dietziae]|uniref:hypothetical protein n=1 Tax=Nonomuraea dietziae TaxID=65515 RepID=UPI003412644D
MNVVWRSFELDPDGGSIPGLTKTFKLSTDPSFESKLRDVTGLDVSPPAAAAVCARPGHAAAE